MVYPVGFRGRCAIMLNSLTLWCFFNSSAFSVIAAFALGGAAALVGPVLISLPPVPNPVPGNPHTQYALVRDLRKRVMWLGGITFVTSLIPLPCYYVVLDLASRETCDLLVFPGPPGDTFLFILYVASCAIVPLYGLFFRDWQAYLRDLSKLPDSKTR